LRPANEIAAANPSQAHAFHCLKQRRLKPRGIDIVNDGHEAPPPKGSTGNAKNKKEIAPAQEQVSERAIGGKNLGPRPALESPQPEGAPVFIEAGQNRRPAGHEKAG